MSLSPLYAGIETGGTKILVRVVDDAGAPQVAAHFATSTPETALADILSCLGSDMIKPRLVAVGLASFGPIRLDPEAADHGRIIATAKPGWSGFDLRGALQAHLAVPVLLDTDVNCAALAELDEGAGQGVASLAYVTVGTGIGAGLATGGTTLQGALHPEIGHARLVRAASDTVASTCPYHGDCAEGLAAGPAVRLRLGGGVRLEDRPETFALVAYYLGQLCATLVLTWAPHRIIVGGGVLGVAGLREALLPEIKASLAGYGPAELLDRPDYLRAPAIADAGLIGALHLARSATHQPGLIAGPSVAARTRPIGSSFVSVRGNPPHALGA